MKSTACARRTRVLERLTVGALVLVTTLVIGPAAVAHPNHASSVEVTSSDGVVELTATIPLAEFETATGTTVGPDADAADPSINTLVLGSVAVAEPGGVEWPLEISDLTVRSRAGIGTIVIELVARGPSGVMPDRIDLTYGLVVDRVSQHRVVVAAGGEIVGTIDGDTRRLEVQLAATSVKPEIGAAGVELEAAGVPGAIGDVVLGTGGAAVWVALLAAIGLGAAHAFAPGHGKTLTAAYLVGSRGTKRHAVLLGLTTAVSHTIGVALLGVVTLVAAETLDATLVYSVLGTASGLAITGIGVVMLVRALRRRAAAHTHPHAHGHDHADGHDHDAGPGRLRWGSLAGLGLAGGMVPSASAVVLLLVAVRFGRAELGLVLVALFGVGMSAVLVGSGLLVLGAEGAVRTVASRRWGSRAIRDLSVILSPIAAAAVTVVGVVWTVQAVM